MIDRQWLKDDDVDVSVVSVVWIGNWLMTMHWIFPTGCLRDKFWFEVDEFDETRCLLIRWIQERMDMMKDDVDETCHNNDGIEE